VGEGDTWTHFLFHFLTGPLRTAAVADRPYRDEDRPNRDPTPSIFLTPKSRLCFSGIAGFLGKRYNSAEQRIREDCSLGVEAKPLRTDMALKNAFKKLQKFFILFFILN
jgi:hypothetical protein